MHELAAVSLPDAFKALEMCESGGGRPGRPVPDKPYGFCGRKATLKLKPYQRCEPVWPSGEAGRLVSRKTSVRFPASALLPVENGCGLWTLSCDFVPHS